MSDFFFDQVDYTSRDYSSIRADLIAQIPSRIPEWTSRDPSDFGITLIELFAYMGDVLHFHIDRAANESFLDTATNRNNVVALAKVLGYTPTEMVPAVTTLTFVNSSGSSLVVPDNTKVATTLSAINSDVVQIVFETDTALTVPANSAASVTATQGKTTTNEALGNSDGSGSQFFQLYNVPVLDGSVTVSVNGTAYQYVEHLFDYGYSDLVFTTETNSDQVTYVRFGDGIHGKIPPLNAAITASYRTGNGSNGNVGAGTLTYITTTVPVGITSVTNATAAYGGADRESVLSIKQNAPISFYALNRAVSTNDFASLSLRVPGIGKASAMADVYSSVIIYVAPTSYTGNPVSTTIKNNLYAYLADKIPVGTTISIQDAMYVDFDLTVTVQTLPQYRRSIVKTAVTNTVKSLFDFTGMTFGDSLSQMYIMAAVNDVPGVLNVSIDWFAKSTSTGVNNTLTFADNEIPRLHTLTIIADPSYGLPDS